MLGLEQNNCFSDREKDLIVAALILHDGWKHGADGSSFTVAEHPTVCSKWIWDTPELVKLLPEKDLEMLTSGISSHMGEFNTDYKSKKEILPKPTTDIQKFIHLCDYLASRKWIEVQFGKNKYDGSYKPLSETDKVVAEIISECINKIASGIDRDTLYSNIKAITGFKNPNKIDNLDVANSVLSMVKELKVNAG